MTAIAAVVGSLAVIFSVDYMHGDDQLGRYYFLVLFFIGAMIGLVLSGNLLFMFFFWEIKQPSRCHGCPDRSPSHAPPPPQDG